MVPVMFWWFWSAAVEPFCPGPWWTKSVCNVSTQDAFYGSSVKALPVRKSNIQVTSVVLKPWVFSLPISFMGEIVLHAELKSTNSILIQLSRWVKTDWRAVDMESSVDLSVLEANWWGSRLAGMLSLMCWRTIVPKHFIKVGVRVTGQ